MGENDGCTVACHRWGSKSGGKTEGQPGERTEGSTLHGRRLLVLVLRIGRRGPGDELRTAA